MLCSGYPTQFLLGILLQAIGVSSFEGGALSARFIFALSIGDTILLLGLITWLLALRGERVSTIVLGARPIVPEIGVGILSVPAIMLIVVIGTLVVRFVIPGLHNVPDNPLEALIGTQSSALAFMLLAIVAGGIREEVQRAFLLHRFRNDLGGAGIGLIVTSVAFGLGHTLQGWDAALITGSLGLAWGVLYVTRGSAVAGMISHSIFNSAEVIRTLL